MATVELQGQAGGYGARQRRYAVWGVTTELAAILSTGAHIAAELPGSILDGLVLRDIAYDEQGDGVYYTTASWGFAAPPQPAETDTFAISFDFAGQAQKVVLPVNPIRVYASTGQVLDHSVRLIGDAGDGEPPEGVDVFEPVLTFSETHYKPADFVDNTYLQILYGLVGRTNAATWRGFPPGSLLATGVSGARRSVRADWELQFKFSARANITDLVLGDITIPIKQGWDFLWPRMGTFLPTTPGADFLVAKKVRQICVTNPFMTASFAFFGIGS